MNPGVTDVRFWTAFLEGLEVLWRDYLGDVLLMPQNGNGDDKRGHVLVPPLVEDKGFFGRHVRDGISGLTRIQTPRPWSLQDLVSCSNATILREGLNNLVAFTDDTTSCSVRGPSLSCARLLPLVHVGAAPSQVRQRPLLYSHTWTNYIHTFAAHEDR